MRLPDFPAIWHPQDSRLGSAELGMLCNEGNREWDCELSRIAAAVAVDSFAVALGVPMSVLRIDVAAQKVASESGTGVYQVADNFYCHDTDLQKPELVFENFQRNLIGAA